TRSLQDGEDAALQNAGADAGMLLHLRKFLRREAPRLQQDAVRDADLADIVQRGCSPDQGGFLSRQSESKRNAGRQLSHALRVLTRLVIPILRRSPEHVKNLRLGELKLLCPLPHPQLQIMI